MHIVAVTLKQLRALSAVAETGSLTAAAEKLSLTPPAIHSQIKNLESAFGVTLLRRSPDASGLVLTAEAGPVQEAAQRIDVVLSQCAARVRALAEGRAGHVTLGVVSTGKYFAPRLVRSLNLICPDIRIVLRIGNREGIISDLEHQSIDLAIMGRPPRVPPVTATLLGPHPHGIMAAPDHPLVGRPALSGDDLATATFIAREPGSGTRILMSRVLDRLGEGKEFDLVEMGSNETIKQAVIAGLGIAFLSLHTVMEELGQGRVVLLDVPGLPMERHWFLVQPSDVRLSPAAERLHAEIVKFGGAYLPGHAPAQPEPASGRGTSSSS
jgi:LysR family transcriptional regulator, low CO2-responsive transcriptional regulator